MTLDRWQKGLVALYLIFVFFDFAHVRWLLPYHEIHSRLDMGIHWIWKPPVFWYYSIPELGRVPAEPDYELILSRLAAGSALFGSLFLAVSLIRDAVAKRRRKPSAELEEPAHHAER